MIGPTSTVAEAQDWLREHLEEGARCPCCKQLARTYRRKMTSVAARAVAALYQEHHLDYGHLPTVARKHLADVQGQGGYLVLGAHWGLIEPEHRRRDDGGRTGYWRVTLHGEQWLLGETTVPEYARIYDGRCLGLSGALIRREDALGQGFDFGHLMRTPAPAGDDQAQLFDMQHPRGHLEAA